MRIAGVRMPQTAVVRTLEDAIGTSDRFGYPVVMKIVSRDILHKSDVGGVVLDIDNQDEAIDAYQAIHRNCAQHRPDAIVEGVEVAQMVRPGVEVIVGARRDPTFGPIAMFGLGGIYVEVLQDVAFRALPLSRREALTMIKQTQSYPLLLGVRGEEPKDIEGVIDVIVRVGAIIRSCRLVTDIEINPLVVYSRREGVTAVDARIMLTP